MLSSVDLKFLPIFTERQLHANLICSYDNTPGHTASNAYRHKVNRYKLWEEAYIEKASVKPNMERFRVNCKVSAFIMWQNHVYSHL